VNTPSHPNHSVRPNLPLAIFLVVVIIGMALFGLKTSYPNFKNKISRPDPLIVTPGPQDTIPSALASLHLIDTNTFTPYNMQARALADGGTQYVASYDASNLQGEYDKFKSLVKLNEMFLLQNDSLQGNNFTLSFGRSFDRLQIFGIGDGTHASGTVVVSFYSRL
jgi:hypothetical protein